MKGSKKQFARYLESEYNDEYLEPLDDNEDNLNLDKISEQLQKYATALSNTAEAASNTFSDSQKPQDFLPQATLDNAVPVNMATSTNDSFCISLRPKHNVTNTELKIKKIEELVIKLGQDARDCASHLTEAQHLQSKSVQAFEKLYRKFETIPVLFLSVVPNQAVYVWQINRLCPVTRECKNGEYNLVVDSKSLDYQVVLHMSLLLLGKILPKEDEEILGAQFLEDEQLCVRSKTEDNELVIRFYSLADFSKHAIINPFKEEVLVNNRHSFEVRMKTTSGSLEVSTWSKKEEEQKLVMIQKLTYGNQSERFIVNDNPFSEIYRGLNGVTVMLDETSSTVVAYKDNEISISSYNIDFFNFAAQVKNSLIIKNIENYSRINFEAFPEIVIDNIGSKLEAELVDELEKSKQEKFMKRQQILCITTNRNYALGYQIFVYDNRLIVRNPYQPDVLPRPEIKKHTKTEGEQEKQEKNEDEEEEKESLSQRIEKMKKKFENTGNERSLIKEKKELLREIRADIGENMREVVKYEEEYRENEKPRPRHSRYQKKDLVEPSGVPKESLELYEKIKEEKKMLDKKREKEKNQMKKDRPYKDEV